MTYSIKEAAEDYISVNDVLRSAHTFPFQGFLPHIQPGNSLFWNEITYAGDWAGCAFVSWHFWLPHGVMMSVEPWQSNCCINIQARTQGREVVNLYSITNQYRVLHPTTIISRVIISFLGSESLSLNPWIVVLHTAVLSRKCYVL